jgi:hypothetical protein
LQIHVKSTQSMQIDHGPVPYRFAMSPLNPYQGPGAASTVAGLAMKHLYQLVGRWIAMIAVCAFLGILAGCAQLSGGAGEGSSTPPAGISSPAPDSGNYVFPPRNEQVYD